MQNNQMNPLEQGAPWLANYGDVPFHLEYPNVSIADAVLKTAEKEKDFPAISFMGKTFSYTVLVEKINQAAAGFVALGVKKVIWSQFACRTFRRRCSACTHSIESVRSQA